jgi:hypothetical protein
MKAFIYYGCITVPMCDTLSPKLISSEIRVKGGDSLCEGQGLMASDWEETFRSWSKPSSDSEQEKCENAERMIREAIMEN